MNGNPQNDLNNQDEILHFNLTQGLFFAYTCAYIVLHHYWVRNIFFGGAVKPIFDIVLAGIGMIFGIIVIICNIKKETYRVTKIACYICEAYCFFKLFFLLLNHFI